MNSLFSQDFAHAFPDHSPIPSTTPPNTTNKIRPTINNTVKQTYKNTGGSTAHKISRTGNCVDISPIFAAEDRKSTRLNSSHVRISYAVFCLKKKKNINKK